ncbi:hypothetical protein BD410DRAFT_795574 [Rickenella mellea]|uniref:Uncharacterized protein n=1 Tax=Rickenella mellea TaxID=50990 RepID=A0A4Y7PLH1_9AGAM|nr:hypothetical protein BD410DRAFT_795574 [Rickenella mellea]
MTSNGWGNFVLDPIICIRLTRNLSVTLFGGFSPSQSGGQLIEIYQCILSNVFLYLVNDLERCWSPLAGTQTWACGDKYLETIRSIKNVIETYRYSMTDMRKISLLESFTNLCHHILGSLPPQSAHNFAHQLATIRSEWAMHMLGNFCSISPPLLFQGLTMFTTLCDVASCLPGFPFSSREHQDAIFVTTDGLLDTASGGRLANTAKPSAEHLRSAVSEYKRVCFRPDYWKLFDPISSRPVLHDDFIYRLYVFTDPAFKPFRSFLVGGVCSVDIPFDRYCAILNEFCSQDQCLYDLQSLAIRKFIKERKLDLRKCGEFPVVIDSRHLAVTRAIWRTRNDKWQYWRNLVSRTAREIGYTSQLCDEGYNLEVHAELQYYDQDYRGNIIKQNDP